MEPCLTLTDADRALIAAAVRDFRTDYVYLERILWAARDRRDRPPAQGRKRAQQARPARKPKPVLPPPLPPALDAILAALEPRLCSYVVPDPSGCWVWIGSVNGTGLPVLRLGRERAIQPVRRWLYVQTREPVPPGRQVRIGDHCQPRCVNPEHAYVLPPGVKKSRELTRKNRSSA